MTPTTSTHTHGQGDPTVRTTPKQAQRILCGLQKTSTQLNPATKMSTLSSSHQICSHEADSWIIQARCCRLDHWDGSRARTAWWSSLLLWRGCRLWEGIAHSWRY